MLNFKKIELTDKNLIKSFLDVWQSPNSTLNFTSFLMWQIETDMKFAIYDDVLYIKLNWEGKNDIFYPPIPMNPDANFADSMDIILDYYSLVGGAFDMRSIDTQFKERIEKDTDILEFIEERSDFDYIYGSSDLINFSGKRYHAKRNHVNKLLQIHSPVYEKYRSEHFLPCWELYQQWLDNKDDDAPGMDGEPDATQTALQYHHELGLSGCVIMIDGKIEAFALGEETYNNTAIISVEKANSQIQGLYPYTTQQFVVNQWSHLDYINRMEDMGIEGMRKAKLSLYPVKFVEKYKAKLKDFEVIQ